MATLPKQCARTRQEAKQQRKRKKIAGAAKPPKDKPSKNGQLVFNPKEFQDDYGRMVRHVTKFRDAHFDGQEGFLISEIRKTLCAFREAMETQYRLKTQGQLFKE
jgi:hypothetical protein